MLRCWNARLASTFVSDLMVMLNALTVTRFISSKCCALWANMFRLVARWHKCHASLRSTTAVWSHADNLFIFKLIYQLILYITEISFSQIWLLFILLCLVYSIVLYFISGIFGRHLTIKGPWLLARASGTTDRALGYNGSRRLRFARLNRALRYNSALRASGLASVA